MYACICVCLYQNRWVAYGHQYFTGNKAEAKAWYHKCIAYDTGRPDCQIFLSRIYLEDGKFIYHINHDIRADACVCALMHVFAHKFCGSVRFCTHID
jgi:hypothetical protein